MHVAHTARVETFDIFSHAARMGCNFLSNLPPGASSESAFDRALDDPVADRTSEAEKEDDVRLIDGTEESDDFMDNGELGVLGASDSGDCGVGLVAASPCHKDTERGAKGGRLRENLGPFIDIKEAMAEVVGEKDPDAL
jgi:hypothetical protein